MKKLLKDFVFLFTIAGLIIFLDQFTKNIVRSNLAVGETWMPIEWLAPFARFVHWKNTGAAFGLFQSASMILAILAIVIAIAIIFYFPQIPEKETLARIALAMQLGGAVGNLIDRLTIGHVTEFISLGSFPVFNVADSSITIGVGILLLSMIISEHKQKNSATQGNEKIASKNVIDEK